MARCTLQIPVSDIRGHIGQAVFSSWKGTPTIRTKPTHFRYPWESVLNANHRDETQLLAKSWRNDLDNTQREAWNTYAIELEAVTHDYTKLSGWKNYGGTMSGWNAFCLTNSLRFTTGESTISETPPDLDDRPSSPGFSSIAYTAGPPKKLTIVYTYAPAVINQTFLRAWLRGKRYSHLLMSKVQEAQQDGPGTWDVMYEAEELPTEATPAWALTGSAYAVADEGILTIGDPGHSEGTEYVLYEASVQTAIALETLMKMEDAEGTNRIIIVLKTGSNAYTYTFFEITRTGLTSTCPGHAAVNYAVDMKADYVKLDIKITASNFSCKVNDVEVMNFAITTEEGATNNQIQWGKPADNVVVSYWDYLYYNYGDYPVTPNPPIEIVSMNCAQGATIALAPDIYQAQLDCVDITGLWSPPTEIKAVQVT